MEKWSARASAAKELARSADGGARQERASMAIENGAEPGT
uniref:Uncharacterized protein n=1 Tax=Arundo donax TaxID=35708 RepID=A0A0A9PXF2_ARUDO